jgi:hypothetical protein
VSPTAALAAAVGAVVGVADRSPELAVVLAATGWAARMGAALIARARRGRATLPRPARLDPYSVPEPWRGLLKHAGETQASFDRAVKTWPAGPTRDRLVDLQPRLYVEVEIFGRVAQHGAELTIHAEKSRPTAQQLTDELQQIHASRRRQDVDHEAEARAVALSRREEAAAAQLRAVQKAAEGAAQIHDHLRILIARLDEAVTSLLVMEADGVPAVGSIDTLADEIAALHAGLTMAAEAAAEVNPDTSAPTLPPPTGLTP